MARINRQSLPQQMAEVLEEDIHAQNWKEYLPGYRVLQDRYQVSKITCEKALQLLESKGFLYPAEPRKRRRICKQKISDNKPQKDGALLIIHDVSAGLDISTEKQLDACSKFWLERGTISRRMKADFAKNGDPFKLITRWCQETHASCILLVQPPTPWIDSAEDTGLPVFRFGGDDSLRNLSSSSGFNITSAFKFVLEHLYSKGHSKILIPWQRGIKFLRNEILLQMKLAVGSQLDDPAIEQLIPLVDHLTENDWHRYWPIVLSKLQPTAVILDQPLEAISLLTFCGKNKITIPDNLSVFVIDGMDPISWMTPQLAHLKFQEAIEVKHFIQWVRQGFLPGKKHRHPFKLIEGSSVADLREKRKTK